MPIESLEGSTVLGLIVSVRWLLVAVASFYLILKIAGLVNALRNKVRGMKVL